MLRNRTDETDWLGNQWSYEFDSLNRLTAKYEPGNTTAIQRLEYNYNHLQTVSRDSKGNPTYFAYDKNFRLIFTTDQEGHKERQEYDNAGNVSAKIDGKGNTTRYEYDQFKQLVLVTDATGHYYLRARYYDPQVRRFTLEDTYRGDGLNLYAYVGNNPVNFIDPSGHAHVRGDGASGGKCGGAGDSVKLNIYTGSRPSNFYGHTDISIGDKVYSFAAYDSPSNSKMNTKGNGVLMVANKDDYLNTRALDRFIISYTLDLTKDEAEKVK